MDMEAEARYVFESDDETGIMTICTYFPLSEVEGLVPSLYSNPEHKRLVWVGRLIPTGKKDEEGNLEYELENVSSQVVDIRLN